MTFAHPWLLPLALAPLLWAAWEWRNSARRGGLAVKAAALAAILLALAEPRVTFNESRVGLAILVDTSASMSQSDLDAASAAATAVEKGRGRNWTQVLPFARAPRNPAPAERAGQAWKLGYSPGQASHGTNLEAAVRDGSGYSAGRTGAARPPDFRWQREPGQRHARHLAGPATRRAHRCHTACRTAAAQPGSGIGEHARAGLQRRAFSRGYHAGFSARRAGHRGDDRRGQASGRQPREPGRRRQPVPRARQRQRHRGDRTGRPRRRIQLR